VCFCTIIKHLLELICCRYCNEILVSSSNASNDLGLRREISLVLASGRMYSMQFTFVGGFSLLGLTSVRVYSITGQTVVPYDSTTSYFSGDKKTIVAVVSAGSACASFSRISLSSSIVTAGQYFIFSLSVRDQFSNSIHGWRNAPVVISSNSSWRQQFDLNDSSSLRLFLTISGVYSISVALSSVAPMSTDVLVVSSNVQYSMSESIFSSSLATAGIPIFIMYTARDLFGNLLPIGNYDGAPNAILVQNNLTDHRSIAPLVLENTSLSAIFTSSGHYHVTFMYNHGTIGSFFEIKVLPAVVCMSLVSVRGSGLSIATHGLPSRFTILARDSYGNVNAGSRWIAFDSSALKYQYLTSTVVGSEHRFLRNSISSSELRSLSVLLITAGPLSATFYADSNFVNPFSVEDVEVNTQQFDFLTSKILHSKSVRFSGYVRTNRRFATPFLFSNCHSSCAQVRIDGVLVYSCEAVSQLSISPGTWFYLQIEHACMPGSFAGFIAARMIIEESVSSAFLSSVSVFRVQHSNGSPFKIHAASGYPFSKAFLAQGNGLSICTFGMLATFSIFIRDSQRALTSLSGSVVDLTVTGKNSSIEQSDVLSCQSLERVTNACSYSYFCGSTTFRIFRLNARVPGLMAEYHETAAFKDYMQQGAIQGFSRIQYDLNSDDAIFSPNAVASDKSFGSHFFSVRWTGLIQAQFSEVHTLRCSSYGSVKLYIDGIMILNKQSTMQSQFVEGTVALLRRNFVDIRIDYVHMMGKFGIKLEWQSKSQPKTDVPASALWHSESGSMLDATVSAVSGTPLFSGSKFTGSGLTIATAGIMASFKLSISDAVSFPGTSQMLSLVQRLGGPMISPIRQTWINSDNSGNYLVSYTPSIVGDYFFDTMLLTPGALTSTVYASSLFLNPLSSIGPVGLYLDDGSFAQSLQSASLLSRMSASWKGFFNPASASITTFKIQLGSASDKVRIVVDGTILFDKKISTMQSATSMSATIFLADSNSFYDIEIDFAHSAGSLKFSVETQHGLIPSSRLFIKRPIGSPPQSLLVRAAAACASTTKVMGAGSVKQLASGLRGSIELHIRDAFNNPTSIGTSYVRATAYASQCSEDALFCDTPVSFVVNALSQSVWNIDVHLTRSGKWSVVVALSQPGSLFATYYSSAGFVSPIAAAPVSLNAKPAVESKSLRILGFIKPIETYKTVSFKWSNLHMYYPSLYIDSLFVRSRAANFTASSSVSDAINKTVFDGRFHDLMIDVPYLQPGSQLGLLWSFENVSWTVVPSQRMFTREHVDQFLIDVLPEKTCASTSYINGQSVTIATCGVLMTFSIISRDRYSNQQIGIQDRWMVRASHNGTTVALVMSDPMNGNMVELIGLTKSTRHDISSTILCT
jgi:hypothetical protein